MSGLWAAAIFGAAAGLFATAVWRLLFPPPPPLAQALARFEGDAPIVTDPTATTLKNRIGRRVGSVAVGSGIGFDQIRADARMAGTSLDAHLGSKVVCAVLPPAFAAGAAGVLLAGGVAIPIPILIGAALLGIAVGFFAPDVSLRRTAAERRAEFTHALGAYLDLVAISLAGGMGTEAALVQAARIGDSWPFQLLERAVEVAHIDGATVWSGFVRLGDELQLPALGELAASVALAGSEGAKVRASIAVKADTLRALALAEAESDAHAATERMAIPTALLLFGFVLLIGFPAVSTVLTGL